MNSQKEKEVVERILAMLVSFGGGAISERLLQEAIKTSREARYYNRSYGYPEEWRPVLREGYSQYVVSNWGYVRHEKKAMQGILRPATSHEYARIAVPKGEAGQTKQHLVHELVAESFILCFPIPKDLMDLKAREIVNHKDGDKWNPALHNLELATQGENLKHAYNCLVSRICGWILAGAGCQVDDRARVRWS